MLASVANPHHLKWTEPQEGNDNKLETRGGSWMAMRLPHIKSGAQCSNCTQFTIKMMIFAFCILVGGAFRAKCGGRGGHRKPESKLPAAIVVRANNGAGACAMCTVAHINKAITGPLTIHTLN